MGGMMSSPRRKVSVVMTVRNDAPACAVTLDSLSQQSLSPDEIVVVDGGSTDETVSMIRRRSEDDSRIRLIESPGSNIARGRNLAVAAATGDLIACTDAGCRLAPDWLAKLVAPFEADIEVEFVAGMYRVEGGTLLERVVGLATMRGQLEPVNPDTFHPSARSMACTKALWSRVGGWPEWIGYSEDTLFDQKVERLGVRSAFAGDAIVHWRPRGSIRAIARQFYRYGTGRGHTQIGAPDFAYNLRNLVLMVVSFATAFFTPWALLAAALLAAYFYVWTFHDKALRIARSTRAWRAYPLCLLVMWVVMFSNLAGYLVGSWQRRRNQERYRDRMEAYLSPIADCRLPIPNSQSAIDIRQSTIGNRQRKRWLCVAYAFPPISRSGTHRTLGFVRHLDRMGWDATVLTVEPRGEPLDESLLRAVPSGTRIIRASCPNLVGEIKRAADWRSVITHCRLPIADCQLAIGNGQSAIGNRLWSPIFRRLFESWDWLSRFLQTPDSRLGWLVPGVRAGLRAVRRRRPDVLYSTSPYASAHLIALVVARLTRIPWVADFRDPWRGNPFGRLEHSSLDRWDAWLERAVLSSAARIICCTPTMTEQLRERYPRHSVKCSTILNGFDGELLDGLQPIRTEPADHVVLTHCGQFYGPRSPAVLFAALRRAVLQSPDLAGRIHLNLIGPELFEGRPLSEWAAEAGVADAVRALGVKSHTEALAHMAGSDGLVLVGSTGLGADLQVPNKLFEYLAVRRPIIAACAPTSPVCDILAKARASGACRDPHDERGLAESIVDAALGRYDDAPGAWSGVIEFERSHRARELLEVFESLRLPSDNRTRCVTAPKYVDRRRVASTRGGAHRVPDQGLQVEERMDDDGEGERTGALVGVAEEDAE